MIFVQENHGQSNNFYVLADILPKKVGETLPAQTAQVGYGIYPYYQHAQPPYLVPQQTSQSPSNPPSNEHANGKQSAQPTVPTSMPPGAIPDYSKLKEPPSVRRHFITTVTFELYQIEFCFGLHTPPSNISTVD